MRRERLGGGGGGGAGTAAGGGEFGGQGVGCRCREVCVIAGGVLNWRGGCVSDAVHGGGLCG